MKHLYQTIITYVAGTFLAASSCALIKPPTIEDKLKATHGCIGTAKGNLTIKNISQRASAAKNRAIENYRINCIGSKAIGSTLQSVVANYDHHLNTAYAYSVK